MFIVYQKTLFYNSNKHTDCKGKERNNCLYYPSVEALFQIEEFFVLIVVYLLVFVCFKQKLICRGNHMGKENSAKPTSPFPNREKCLIIELSISGHQKSRAMVTWLCRLAFCAAVLAALTCAILGDLPVFRQAPIYFTTILPAAGAVKG